MFQGIGSVDSAQDESGVDVRPTSSDLARKRYQVTMAASEKTKMMVEMALISGVMPRRSRPQISRESVVASDQEEAYGDFVHRQSEDQQGCPDNRKAKVGQSHSPEGLPIICAKIGEASSCARSSFCRPAKTTVVATEIRAVPWPRTMVSRLAGCRIRETASAGRGQ